MSAHERYKEQDGTVHAAGPFANDSTLCGDAYGGEHGDAAMERTGAQINCYRCVAVVRVARRIRPSEISEEASNA